MKSIDIETIPNMDLVASLPEPEVALGNTKDPAKVAEKIAEAKKKQIEQMGLNPFYGRICSFSSYSTEKQYYHTIKEATDAEEINLITHILEALSIGDGSNVRNVIITWNGFTFDLPYIYKRAALLKIEMPIQCPGLKYWTRKYSSDVHIDLMRELSNWEPHGMNLNEAGRCFLGQGKTERDYSTYAELIKTGQGDVIGRDNLCDTELTYKIYERVAPYLF
jgi:DNA polymerase elongation subunit (family B)